MAPSLELAPPPSLRQLTQPQCPPPYLSPSADTATMSPPPYLSPSADTVTMSTALPLSIRHSHNVHRLTSLRKLTQCPPPYPSPLADTPTMSTTLPLSVSWHSHTVHRLTSLRQLTHPQCPSPYLSSSPDTAIMSTALGTTPRSFISGNIWPNFWCIAVIMGWRKAEIREHWVAEKVREK